MNVKYIAHWSENAVLGQQFVFSRLLADFNAQYSKLGVLWVRESIYEKKIHDLEGQRPLK